MLCKHDFVRISDVSKPRPGAVGYHAGIAGAEVGCLRCGEIRRVWTDGTVEITVHGGKPLEVDAGI